MRGERSGSCSYYENSKLRKEEEEEEEEAGTPQLAI
jgi:hypothetical protein